MCSGLHVHILVHANMSMPACGGLEPVSFTDWKTCCFQHKIHLQRIRLHTTACLNSCPPTPLSCDGDSVKVLTPGHWETNRIVARHILLCSPTTPLLASVSVYHF